VSPEIWAMEPAVAVRPIVPVPAVTTLPVPVKVTLRAAVTVMLPVPLRIPAVPRTSALVPPAETKMLPLPLALIACVSAFTPSVKVIEPPVVTRTMEPLDAVTRSDRAVVGVPGVLVESAATTCTAIGATVPMVMAVASSTLMPPEVSVLAANVPTLRLIGAATPAPKTPIPVPASNRAEEA